MEKDHHDKASFCFIEQVYDHEKNGDGDQDPQAHIGKKTVAECLQVSLKNKREISRPKMPETGDKSHYY